MAKKTGTFSHTTLRVIALSLASTSKLFKVKNHNGLVLLWVIPESEKQRESN